MRALDCREQNLLGALVLLVDGLLGAGGSISPHGVKSQETLPEVLHLVASEGGQLRGPDLSRGGSKRVTGEGQRGGGHQAGGELEESVSVQQGELTEILREATL